MAARRKEAHRGKHIGMPLTTLLIVLGAAIIGTAYLPSKLDVMVFETIWGIIAILAGIATWVHHAWEEKK